MRHSPQQRLPAEIWEECWKHVPKAEDIRSLSETCSLFRDICQPILFESIEYYPHDIICVGTRNEDYDKWKKETQFAYLRLNFLASHPKYRLYVKKLVFCAIPESQFKSRSDFNFREPYNLLESSFRQALIFFERLRSVTLLKVMVDDAMMKALSQLSFLKHAGFSCPTFALGKFPPVICLESLYITYTMNGEGYALAKMFSNQTLKKLTLAGCPAVHLPYIIQENFNNALTNLSLFVEISNLSLVVSLLELCPLLEQLTLYEHTAGGSVPFPQIRLSEGAIPLLHYYQGPSNIGLSIVPKRPVSTISSMDDSMEYVMTLEKARQSLRALSQSTASVQELQVSNLPVHREIFNDISSLFLHLRSLSMNFNGPVDLLPESDPDYDRRAYLAARDNGCRYTNRLQLMSDEPEIPLPDTLKGLLEQMSHGKFALPATLEKLMITHRHEAGTILMPFKQERDIVLRLSERYPTLEKVSIGLEFDWAKYSNRWWPDSFVIDQELGLDDSLSEDE